MTSFAIDQALDHESYEWLMEQRPQLLQALERDVAAGWSPERIRQRVIERTQRPELAARCEQAARHIARAAE